MTAPTGPTLRHLRTYQAYLEGRWRPRMRVLAVLASLLAPLLVVADRVDAALAGRPPPPWLTLAALRLPLALAAVAGMAFHRLPRRLQAPAVLLACGVYFLVNDWGFYAFGRPLGALHLSVLFIMLVACLSYVPLQPGARLGMIILFVAGHVALDLAVPQARTVAARLWESLALTLTATAMSLTVDGVFRAHRRAFLLRQETSDALAELHASRAEVSQAVKTLTGAMSDFTQGTRALDEGSSHSREASRRMASAVESLARSARALEERSRGGAGTAAEAATRTQSAEALLAGMEAGVRDIESAVLQSEASFRRFEDQAARIGAFLEGMEEVAAQTQLLAVNAGIEAHRAGAFAQGFSIIAAEVRKLAQQAAGSSREMGDVVLALKQQMEALSSSVGSVRRSTGHFLDVHAQTRTTLAAVGRSVSDTERAMRENARDATQQAGVTQELSGYTQELQQHVDAQAALATQMTAATRQLGALAGRLGELLPREGDRAA